MTGLYDKLAQATSGKRYWNDGTPVAGQQFEYGSADAYLSITHATQWMTNISSATGSAFVSIRWRR